jgi:antitoxin ParD1/3/4
MDAIDKLEELSYDLRQAIMQQEHPMQLSLSPEVGRQIAEKVESGEYESAEDVVLHALRALSREDREYASRLEALRGEIQKGIDSLDNGQHSPKDEVFARLRARREQASV